MLRLLGAVCASALLSGCALINAARIDSSGVPVKSEDGFQSVDLPLALDPASLPSPNSDVENCIRRLQGRNCTGVGTTGKISAMGVLRSSVDVKDDGEDAEEIVERLRLATAYYNFYHAPQQPGQNLEDRRNRVQDTLMGASDMNCAIFTQRIYGIQATGNFTLGSLATILGAAGAIVTDVDSARLLSGLSSATSGVRAEMNEDFFRKQWIEALVKSIENERNRIRGEIETARLGKSISQYSVQAAVRDALLYNEACSLVSGLKEVNHAVAIADDPAGLRAFRESYARAGFEASFSATVTSSDQRTSTRLRPASTATASVALGEIDGDIAETRASIAETKARLKALKAEKEDLDKATGEIDGFFKELFNDTGGPDGKGAYGPRLLALRTQLTRNRDAYDSLRADLVTAASPEAQEEVRKLMNANDVASEIIRRAARDAVINVGDKVTKVANDLTSKITEATAEQQKAAAEQEKATAEQNKKKSTVTPPPGG